MGKLHKIIKDMKKSDLINLQKDVVEGNLSKLIKLRLDEIEPRRSRYCPVCGMDIDDKAIALEFGSTYLRRKAFFDEVDCLKYFVDNHIKKQRQE